MQKLTQSMFKKSRQYLKNQARVLETSLFRYHFENLPAEDVLVELAKFQNEDGGFGKALEPDMRSPSSSALATEIALRTLVELGVSAENPMVQTAITYLLKTLNQRTKTWRVVPLDVNQFPHAPWWHDESGSLAETFDDYRTIPRAGILAIFYYFPELLPKDTLDKLTESTIPDLLEMDDDRFSGGGDALVYARRLAEAPGLPEEIRSQLSDRVCIIADRIVTRDESAWSQYSAPPLKLAPTPESMTANILADCLPANLDFLIGTQNPEGYWDVTWSWNDYPVDWEIARSEWRGILTLEALLSLRAYGRIET